MSNPNTLSPYFPEYWSKMAQVLHKPKAIYRQIANFRAEAILKNGDTFRRIRPTAGFVSPYTRNTDIPNQPAVGTNESLVVDKEYAFRYQIDEFDSIQSSVDVMRTYGDNAAKDLANALDSDLLYNATGATSLIDAGSVGGTPGLPVALTGSTVIDAFTTIHQKLAEQNVGLEGLYGVIDPATFQVILANTSARETAFGDDLTRKGVAGDMYSGRLIEYFGLQIYVTNNYTRSVVLDLATNPTDGDTVTYTIGGTAVVFTFVDTIGSTPGNVHIEASADLTRANLASLINAPTTTNSGQVGWAVNTDDEIISRLAVSSVAVNNDTANTLTVYAKGQTITTAETLTDVTDGFNAAQASKHLMFGQKGSIDMVVQEAPTMMVRPEPRNRAMNIMGTALFGTKLYTDGAEQLVQMRVAA